MVAMSLPVDFIGLRVKAMPLKPAFLSAEEACESVLRAPLAAFVPHLLEAYPGGKPGKRALAKLRSEVFAHVFFSEDDLETYEKSARECKDKAARKTLKDRLRWRVRKIVDKAWPVRTHRAGRGSRYGVCPPLLAALAQGQGALAVPRRRESDARPLHRAQSSG